MSLTSVSVKGALGHPGNNLQRKNASISQSIGQRSSAAQRQQQLANKINLLGNAQKSGVNLSRVINQAASVRATAQ